MDLSIMNTLDQVLQFIFLWPLNIIWENTWARIKIPVKSTILSVFPQGPINNGQYWTLDSK